MCDVDKEAFQRRREQYYNSVVNDPEYAGFLWRMVVRDKAGDIVAQTDAYPIGEMLVGFRTEKYTADYNAMLRSAAGRTYQIDMIKAE